MSEATTTASGLPTTRPAVASRKARRPAGGARKVTRYTLDLENEMHKGLRMLALSEGVDTSKIMRGLVWLLISHAELPAGKTLAEIVLDDIFAEEDATHDNETGDETPPSATSSDAAEDANESDPFTA